MHACARRFAALSLLLLTFASRAFAQPVQEEAVTYVVRPAADIAAWGERALYIAEDFLDTLVALPAAPGWVIETTLWDAECEPGGVPARQGSVDALRDFYARRLPGRDGCAGDTWEVRSRWHGYQPKVWHTVANGIPAAVRSLDSWSGSRFVVGFDGGTPKRDDAGTWIYEYNGSGNAFVKVAEMVPHPELLQKSNPTGLAALDEDTAIAVIDVLEPYQENSDSWLVVYQRAGPGHWIYVQALRLADQKCEARFVFDLAMHGRRAVVSTHALEGTSGQCLFFLEQSPLGVYSIAQTVSDVGFGHGWQLEMDDAAVYAADPFADEIAEYTFDGRQWSQGFRLRHSQSVPFLGLTMAVTPDQVLAITPDPTVLDQGWLVVFDRPTPGE